MPKLLIEHIVNFISQMLTAKIAKINELIRNKLMHLIVSFK